MFTTQPYLEIARNISIFTPEEIEMAESILFDYAKNPGLEYQLLDEKENGVVTGFIIFDRIPITAFSWDVYWIIVDQKLQGRGIGKKLFRKMEEFILSRDSQANIRIETSSRKEYLPARKLYLSQGYYELSRIQNFYNQGDDVITYLKKLTRHMEA